MKLNQHKIINILLSIKTIVVMLLATLTIVWIVALFMPWWISINGNYQFFKFSIVICLFLFLFLDCFLILREFFKLKKIYHQNNNEIHLKLTIKFIVKIILGLLVLLFIFLFLQNLQDFTNITSIYFQNKGTLVSFVFLVLIILIFSIFELVVENIKQIKEKRVNKHEIKNK